MITRAELMDVLSYDPATGIFVWKTSPNGRVPIGLRAGFLSDGGPRLSIKIKRKTYVLARLAWLYMTGEWPSGVIDHINGNCADDRFANLRSVSLNVNAQNQRRAHVSNKVGLLGVTSCRNKFRASINVNGKKVHLGSFSTPEEAHARYVAAKREFHAGCTI